MTASESKLSKFKLYLEEPPEDLPQLTFNMFDVLALWWKNRKAEK